MLRIFLFIASLGCVPGLAWADVEFEGVPVVRVGLNDGQAETAAVPPGKAAEFRVVITRDGDQYFWASRKNIPLVKTESGAYVTYVATTGAGYIRVLAPFMREMHAKLPREERLHEFVYMEHMTATLGSVTYYGN